MGGRLGPGSHISSVPSSTKNAMNSVQPNSFSSSTGNQTMDHPRLAARSETFTDDEGTRITKRCYFLAIGDDDHQGNAFSLVLSFNAFDEPDR